jgi:hypothetical protein
MSAALASTVQGRELMPYTPSPTRRAPSATVTSLEVENESGHAVSTTVSTQPRASRAALTLGLDDDQLERMLDEFDDTPQAPQQLPRMFNSCTIGTVNVNIYRS